MRRIKKKQRDKSSLLWYFLVLLVSLVIVGVTVRDVVRIRRTEKQIALLKVKIDKIQKEAERLRMEVEWLEAHPQAKEPFAKDALEVQRPSETVVVVKSE